MKKNLIYTVVFLLLGTLSFSSCQDMLNVDSDRVEYEFDDWTASDSVYSVLGILKSVQGVADRQILLNELRADLITPSKTKAVTEVQEICNFNFKNLDDNKYLDVKDYYTIINNCNVFLKRVDTTLSKNGVYYMLPEYVAVKSIRAWTYLQLAVLYDRIPYFTEPILTHSAAENVMNSPKLPREEVMDQLINDILPYENPSVYSMPAWDYGGSIIPLGYGSTKVKTEKLFVPIRMLLGEMFLWKGDYKNAAMCFYGQITGYGTNGNAAKYNDHAHVVKYNAEKGKTWSNGYSSLFAADNYSTNSNRIFTVIPFAENDLIGTTSDLASVFSPQSDLGGAQVFASPGFVSLARQQKYLFVRKNAQDKVEKQEYGDAYEYPGDLRIKATTYSQIGDDDEKTEYDNIIAKFNLKSASGYRMDMTHTPSIRTTFVTLQRAELAYLRFAEALVGMARQGYEGALDLAMIVLKEGPKVDYPLIQNPDIQERHVLNENGDTLKNYVYDKLTGQKIDSTYVYEKYLAGYADSLGFDFTNDAFDKNIGIHSRGSGESELNKFYALDEQCIAQYHGLESVPVEGFDLEDSLNYVSDLIIDELALELSWEGTRFGDLVRFAKAMDDPDVLAMRIAGRDYANNVRYRAERFEFDSSIREMLRDENNWYLPLPDEVVEPAKPVEGEDSSDSSAGNAPSEPSEDNVPSTPSDDDSPEQDSAENEDATENENNNN